MLMPVRSELCSLHHSRIVDVAFQEDGKNYRLFIPKRYEKNRIQTFICMRNYNFLANISCLNGIPIYVYPKTLFH